MDQTAPPVLLLVLQSSADPLVLLLQRLQVLALLLAGLQHDVLLLVQSLNYLGHLLVVLEQLGVLRHQVLVELGGLLALVFSYVSVQSLHLLLVGLHLHYYLLILRDLGGPFEVVHFLLAGLQLAFQGLHLLRNG